MLWRVPEPALLVFYAAVLAVALGLGYRLGLSRAQEENDRSFSQLTTMQAALLGLLALLLGFSFSMATERWEMRKRAAIDEANAIGTTYLRTSLLPEPQRSEIRAQLVAYVDARLSPDVMSPRPGERARSVAEAERIQSRVWELAVAAAFADPRPTTSGLFLQSLNAMIDAHGTRVALGEDRVPEIVLWILLAVGAGALGLTGYATGAARRSRLVSGLLVAGIIALVIVLIVDLDRPSRGVIRVSDANLRELRTTMQVGP